MNPEKSDARGTPPGAGTIAPAHGGRIGNPPFQPTEEQRQTVLTYAKVMSQEMIADALDISVDTLVRHFRKELD
jgi:DNA invertase Pin-like site-specific DNA recombinase